MTDQMTSGTTSADEELVFPPQEEFEEGFEAEEFDGLVTRFYKTTWGALGVQTDNMFSEQSDEVLRIEVRNLSRKMDFDYNENFTPPKEGKKPRKNSKLSDLLATSAAALGVPSVLSGNQLVGQVFHFRRSDKPFGKVTAKNHLTILGMGTISPDSKQVADQANASDIDPEEFRAFVLQEAVGKTPEQAIDAVAESLADIPEVRKKAQAAIMGLRTKRVLVMANGVLAQAG